MDSDSVISKIRNVKEAPTKNIGSGDIGKYDKLLFLIYEELLSKDY